VENGFNPTRMSQPDQLFDKKHKRTSSEVGQIEDSLSKTISQNEARQETKIDSVKQKA
jgi:hypothetical protein